MDYALKSRLRLPPSWMRSYLLIPSNTSVIQESALIRQPCCARR